MSSSSSPPCPRLRRSEVTSLLPPNPRFSYVVSAPGEASISSSPPTEGRRKRKGDIERERDIDREREENPRPFTGLLAVAAVSYLGLRGAPLYRRTATLGSPSPRLLLTFSTPFPILSLSLTWSLALAPPKRRGAIPFPPTSEALSISLSLRPFLPRSQPEPRSLPALFVRLSGFLSGTFASPTSVTRDCRDSEDIDAVGELPARPTRAGSLDALLRCLSAN